MYSINHYLCKVEVYALLINVTKGFRLWLEPFLCIYVFTYLRNYINTYLHIYIFIFWYFNNSPYICSAKLHDDKSFRRAPGQMLNTKLGFFYVHRYHIADISKMVALYEICRYLLYAINAFGCLSQHFIARKGCIVVQFGDFGKWQPFLHPVGCKRTCLRQPNYITIC